MQYYIMRCSTMQHNSIQFCRVQYTTISCNAMQYNILYSTMPYYAVKRKKMRCDAVQYNAIQSKTIQCNTALFGSRATELSAALSISRTLYSTRHILVLVPVCVWLRALIAFKLNHSSIHRKPRHLTVSSIIKFPTWFPCLAGQPWPSIWTVMPCKME